MALDPALFPKLDSLLATVKTSEQALADASDANDTAQANAQAAIAAANASAQQRAAAHDALASAIDDLETFLTTLKADPAPAPAPAPAPDPSTTSTTGPSLVGAGRKG
jgi:hypothetical protein